MALSTNACYGQPKYVEAVQAPALKYGIFSVANLTQGDGDYHWQQGVEWETDECGPASTYDCPTCVQNDGNTAPAKTYTSGIPLEEASPFTVYGSFKCSPIGNWERGEEHARRALLTGEERAVEAMMAAGAHTGARALYGAGTTDITPVVGTPVTVAQGLALLEQYIGENGKGEGVIVGARRDILLANANGKLICPRDENTLYTILGTPVAALAGINGKTGPNNDAPEANEAWLWALGSRPRIWRGEVFLTSDRERSLNTLTNDLEILAERNYVIGWDCFTVGVLISTVGTA